MPNSCLRQRSCHRQASSLDICINRSAYGGKRKRVHTGEDVMQQRIAIGLAVLAGAALGAAGVQGIHAQGKTSVYYVAEIDVTNPEAYATEYAPKAQAIIKAHGGRHLAIGGTGAAGAVNLTAFEGEPPKRAVVQVWESMEAIQTWRNDPDFKALRETGGKYAKFR